MNRQIKFRIWNYETETWRYLDLLAKTSITLLDTDNLNSLGQLTGLYDCNNAEIWEGDIVLYKGRFSTKKYTVYYALGDFCVAPHAGMRLSTLKRNRMEVAGNKVENPEFLENKQ